MNDIPHIFFQINQSKITSFYKENNQHDLEYVVPSSASELKLVAQLS